MAIDDRFRHQFEELRQQREELRGMSDLKGDGGGGTSGGMEARIARLEADMDHVKKAVDRLDRGQEAMRGDVATMRVDVGKLMVKVDALPSKPWIFTTLAGMLVATATVVGLIVRLLPGQ